MSAPARRRVPRARERRDPLVPAMLAMLAGAVLVLVALLLGTLSRRPRPPRHALTMDEARAVNAAIPFDPAPLVAAHPFVFHGGPAAREQAIGCLATAARYEAGDDVRGQRAVMQVVLNRVVAPGFPKTVCGVVYQGAALATGCQFSFACDGSLTRRTERTGWHAVRLRAAHALAGTVFRPVGTATHYHADWTVPWWIGSLDKIAGVGPHLFYRRPGHVGGDHMR